MSDDFKLVRIQNDRKHFLRGCHCDLNDGERPDECVFDLGRVNDCSAAMQLAADGRGRDDCEHWRPETPQPKPVVITDEQREAIAYGVMLCEATAGMANDRATIDGASRAADVLRGLLERTK
jgi:hypothetical protein